jgi:hypothetical protein
MPVQRRMSDAVQRADAPVVEAKRDRGVAWDADGCKVVVITSSCARSPLLEVV